jgi:hypothetical protein
MTTGAEPTYHRVASPTQSVAIAQKQRASREIWGTVPRGGCDPVVEAYRGPLRPGQDGVEFTVALPPDPGSAPSRPEWRPPRVRKHWDSGIEYAVLEQVTVTKIVDGGQLI